MDAETRINPPQAPGSPQVAVQALDGFPEFYSTRVSEAGHPEKVGIAGSEARGPDQVPPPHRNQACHR